MAVKKILVACGTAIATSTVVAKAVEDALRERGVEVVTRQCKASEVPALAKDADLVVTTVPLPVNVGVPVIQTLAFLTGIGKETAIQQIIKVLEQK